MLLLCAIPLGVPARADGSLSQPPSEIAAKLGHQRLRQLIAARRPELPPKAVEELAQGFEEHLRRTSRLAADDFADGRLDEGELTSRLSVFLADNREPFDGRLPDTDSILARVRSALSSHDSSPGPLAGRAAIAERFIQELTEHNRIAYQNLSSGKMSDDELASRIAVFLENLKAETLAPSAPAAAQAAATELFAEQFIRQNFGAPGERALTLVYDCTITDAETNRTQKLMIMRKSPNKLRIHLLAGDLATQVMYFDGSRAWAQRISGPATLLDGDRAAALVESAPFDHPLIGYKARGATLTMRGGGAEPFELTLHERDGRTIISSIDPVSLQETRQIVRSTSGRTSELRLGAYTRVGAMNVPCTQEVWRDGTLRRTTRLANLNAAATLLDSLFTPSPAGLVDYMDYMGGMAVLQSRQTNQAAADAAIHP